VKKDLYGWGCAIITNGSYLTRVMVMYAHNVKKDLYGCAIITNGSYLTRVMVMYAHNVKKDSYGCGSAIITNGSYLTRVMVMYVTCPYLSSSEPTTNF